MPRGRLRYAYVEMYEWSGGVVFVAMLWMILDKMEMKV